MSFLDVGQGDAALDPGAGGSGTRRRGPAGGSRRGAAPAARRSPSRGARPHPSAERPHRRSGRRESERRGRRDPRSGPGRRKPVPGRGPRAAASEASSGRRARRPAVPHRVGSALRVLWPADARSARRPIPTTARRAARLVRLRGSAADSRRRVERHGCLALRPVEIVKVAHHGSADAGLPALLDRLRPRLAVISVGSDNDYGHPTRETLAALRRPRLRLLRTDETGR